MHKFYVNFASIYILQLFIHPFIIYLGKFKQCNVNKSYICLTSEKRHIVKVYEANIAVSFLVSYKEASNKDIK